MPQALLPPTGPALPNGFPFGQNEDDQKDGSEDFHKDWDSRVQLPRIWSLGNTQILPKSWNAL